MTVAEEEFTGTQGDIEAVRITVEEHGFKVPEGAQNFLALALGGFSRKSIHVLAEVGNNNYSLAARVSQR
jgi:galactokinase/mevalonate kinase-like predicted kinase